MATAENPFPDKKSQRLKQSYVSGIYNTVAASAQPQIPLYFDETIAASNQKVNFEEMVFDHESSLRSGKSGSSSTTFRDTQVD